MNFRGHFELYSPESPSAPELKKQEIHPEVFEEEFDRRFQKLEESKAKQVMLADELQKIGDAQEISQRRRRPNKTATSCKGACKKKKFACLDCKLKLVNEEKDEELAIEKECQHKLDWFLDNFEPRPYEAGMNPDDNNLSDNGESSSSSEYSSSDEDMDDRPVEVKQEVRDPEDGFNDRQLYADGPRSPLFPNAVVVPLRIQPGFIGMANVIKAEPMETDSDSDSDQEMSETSDEDMPSDSSDEEMDYDTSDDDQPMMPEEEEGAEIMNPHPISRFL